MEEHSGKNMPDRDRNVQKERRERSQRRKKLLEEQRRREEQKARRARFAMFKVTFFLILAALLLGGYYVVENGIAADFLMHQGQKYIEIKEYDKALQLLKIAESMNPENENNVYLQVVALSKKPISYESQKALYQISQYDDLEETSEYAYKVLSSQRRQIDNLMGSNYVDNVMYNGIIYRWNNKTPITYTINAQMPPLYANELKRAFVAWSALTNGAVLFKEIHTVTDADIVISMADVLPEIDPNDTQRSAVTIPVINDNILSYVEIVLNASQIKQAQDNPMSLATVLKSQIGHALGIAGYSYDENDVMHSSGDYISKAASDKDFSLRDFNTITLLYKMVPDVINDPLMPEEYSNLFYGDAITSIPGSGIDYDMKLLMQSLNYNPQDIPKWVELANNYGEKRYYRHANAILKNLLPFVRDNNQNYFAILYNISVNFYKTKDYANASRYIKEARKIDNADIDALVLETFINLKSNNKEKALLNLVNINKRYPDNIEVALKLAYLYRKNKDTEKVNDVIRNLIKSNPRADLDSRVKKYKN